MLTKTARMDRPRQANQTAPLITTARQNHFLELLSTSGLWKQSCEQLQLNPATPWLWGNKSERFKKRLDEARVAGEKVLLNEYESQMHARILAGKDDPGSTNLTMFRVKRLDPAYRDNAVVNVNAVGPVAIQFNLNQSLPQARDEAEPQA